MDRKIIIVSAIFCIIAFLLATDFLKLSPISGKNFQPVYGPPLPKLPHFWVQYRRTHLRRSKQRFFNELYGPESIAFDSLGRPYASVSDGRVIRWEGPVLGWKTFATPTNRSEKCEHFKMAPNLRFEPECGRPLGLHFSEMNKGLYFCDSYFGVMFVDSNGGLAKVVVDQIDGVKFKFTNDLAVDEENDIVYFTESSKKYYRREFLLESMEGGPNGRLLKHEMRFNKTTILLDPLRFPNGVSLSKDKSFLLISENTQCRILRYWLRGEKEGSHEIFLDLPGFPDNIRITERGTFWVAINTERSELLDLLRSLPSFRKQILSLPIPLHIIYGFLIGRPTGLAVEFDEAGKILNILEDSWGERARALSEVHERNGELFMGSIMTPYIAVLKLN